MRVGRPFQYIESERLIKKTLNRVLCILILPAVYYYSGALQDTTGCQT